MLNKKRMERQGYKMKVLVWGFGNYYKEKKDSLSEDEVLALISSIETGKHEGFDVISPTEISQYAFDKIYIMVEGAVFEILETLRQTGFEDWNKVVLGWSIAPYIGDEALLFEDGEMRCNAEGICIYISQNQVTEIKNAEDLRKLKQKKTRSKKENPMSDISYMPISKIFGIDRGMPIDRYYIEGFLRDNSCYIHGTVLEVSERKYTEKYGTEVKESYITHVCDSSAENSMIVNLETGEGVVEGIADCFILTQTLNFIFDVREAARNIVKCLKAGGVALVTVSGITQISRYDMERWGHYWNFTTASVKKLFEGCSDVESLEVNTYGNAKSAVSGLYGLAVEDMEPEDLAYRDDDYQQIITAVIKKRRNQEH